MRGRQGFADKFPDRFAVRSLFSGRLAGEFFFVTFRPLNRQIMITKLDQIVRAVQGRGRKKLAVAYAQDSHTLEAVNAATDMGIVEAILIGDVLMKGLVSTDKYMRGILNKDFGLLPPKGVLSHVAVLELPMYHKLLLVSDVAVIPYPDMNQKIRIAKYLIGTSRTLGIRAPKLAVIAPSEQMLPGIQSSVDAAILAKMGDRGQLGDALVDGPLAVDVDQAVRRPVGRYGRRNAVPVRIDLARRLARVEALFDRAGRFVRRLITCRKKQWIGNMSYWSSIRGLRRPKCRFTTICASACPARYGTRPTS